MNLQASPNSFSDMACSRVVCAGKASAAISEWKGWRHCPAQPVCVKPPLQHAEARRQRSARWPEQLAGSLAPKESIEEDNSAGIAQRKRKKVIK